MLILGLNAFHGDSAACLVRDGQLVAAVEEERFRRVKHWAGFPSEAIRYCLRETGVGLDAVGHIAINQDRQAHLWRKIGYTLAHRPDLGLVLDRLHNKRKRAGVAEHLARAFPDQRFTGQVHAVEHHLAHLSSAFHVAPFSEAVVVSVDGFGDFASVAWGVGRGARIEVEDRIYFPHSLGIFYQALTQYLGFPHYGDEYKVMGLAPYGEPRHLDAMRCIVRLEDGGGFRLNLDYFRHHREKIDYEWSDGSPTVGRLYGPALEDLLGPARAPDQSLEPRHRDIARSVQAMYEEAFFHLLDALHARHRLDAVAIAGGCGMNSVANGKVRRMTPFRQVYVQSAASDAGGAIGAAFVTWHRLGAAGPRFHMDHAYWGPRFGEAELGEALERRREELNAQNCRIERVAGVEERCRLTARAVADGQVIGWFQGRMEWGPRALGNRSIVCDPRRPDMKDILNRKIKRRESFRPFAPSILREAVADWFEEEDEVPFMMQVFQIREEKRSLVPAVTHVDGSGRLQTVHRATNPLYHRLIAAFRDLTGVPMVLNTSFNENEPVVCRPEEALDCFLRTHMDLLVLGEWLVRRAAPAS
ncbi:MAG TPA: carbamoyltransferase C-terminal domain-containing protein [Candidatus Competibacter sp.]|nr:carbamoyltransferase [Candidatus Competibacteraceae bacterium]HPE71614.1 carbamoyltransferase C-terminal domain-containing protein [Candidatus Competibacter sp.]HRW66426.1 carbamoyltransferase C-terminal domain-containing protein [Candidatus Competibacter sp.]